MSAIRGLAAGIFAASLLVAAGPAMAKAKANPSAAAKLRLAGAQGANECIPRPGQEGEWKQDAAGAWIRCKPAGADGGSGGGGGIGIGYILGGGAALGGIIAGVVSGSNGTPSSP